MQRRQERLQAATDAHRQFVQALLALGVAERAQAAQLHRQACHRHRVHYAHDKLDDFIRLVNAQLQPLSMEIRKGLAEGEENNGRTFYALVNLAETEITQMASDYSESELELFKKILDLIVLSGNGFASSTDILNAADQLKPKKMKKVEAEQLLQSLVRDKWLQEREGEYTLHVRGILELEQYILRHYPDSARKCHLCHRLSIQSQVCEDCGVATHLPCLSKYFHTQTEQRCPNCKQFWPNPIPEVSLGSAPPPLPEPPKESSRASGVTPRRR